MLGTTPNRIWMLNKTMSKRRVYTPVASWHDDIRVHVPSCTVYEAEDSQQFSGLYDANGNKLMVSVRSEPIGFVYPSKDDV